VAGHASCTHTYDGPAAVRAFLDTSIGWRSGRRLTLIPTIANTQQAFGCYLADHHAARAHFTGIVVLTMRGDLVAGITREAATLLHNGLALDGLDGHDASAVDAGLCLDLVAQDPGAAVRARSQATLEGPGDLHDTEGVSAAYLVAAAILQL
jgi:hypothetical protein